MEKTNIDVVAFLFPLRQRKISWFHCAILRSLFFPTIFFINPITINSNGTGRIIGQTMLLLTSIRSKITRTRTISWFNQWDTFKFYLRLVGTVPMLVCTRLCWKEYSVFKGRRTLIRTKQIKSFNGNRKLERCGPELSVRIFPQQKLMYLIRDLWILNMWNNKM